MYKRIFIISLMAVIFLSAGAFSASAASDRIGFIDTQRILASHPKYEESQKYLDGFITKKSDEARAAAEKEPDAAKRLQIIEKARNESGLEEMRIMNPITAEINKVIESVARAKGVTVVVEKVYIFFGGVDVTEEVIKGVKAIK